MPQQGVPEKEQETLGWAVDRLLQIHSSLRDPELAAKKRRGTERAYQQGLGLLAGFQSHPEFGKEVSDLLYRFAYTDALGRLEKGELNPTEQEWLQDVRRSLDDPEQGWSTREDLGLPLIGYDAHHVSDKSVLQKLYRVDEPIAPGARAIPERGFFAGMAAAVTGSDEIEISDELRSFAITEQAQEEHAYKSAVALGPTVTRPDGRRVVETHRGPRTLTDFSQMQKAAIGWAQSGGATGGPTEPIQFLFHKAVDIEQAIAEKVGRPGAKDVLRGLGFEYGLDYNVTDALGNTWAYVPVVTGNFTIDKERLTSNPVYVRSLMESGTPDGWLGGVTKYGMMAAQTVYFLSTFPMVTKGTAAPFAALARQGHRLPLKWKAFPKFAGRYVKAAKEAAGAGRAVAAPPLITGTARSIVDFAHYEAASAAITGSENPFTAAMHGAKLGMVAAIAGQSARVIQGLAARTAGAALALTKGKPGFLWRTVAPQPEAEAFVSHMQKGEDRIVSEVARATKSRAVAQTLGHMWSSQAVGQSFGSLAASEQELGREVDPTKIADLKVFARNLFGVEAIAQGLLFAGWSGLHGYSQFKAHPRGIPPAQRKALDDAQEWLKLSLEEMSAEAQTGAVRSLYDLIEREGTIADMHRYLRDETGRRIPHLGDPVPEKYGLKDLLRWREQDAEFAADILRVASTETLERIIRESRALTGNEKHLAGMAREFAEDVIEARAKDPKLEEAALAKRIELAADPFGGPGEVVEGAERNVPRGTLATLAERGSPVDLKALGFKHPKHALNALKKYTGETHGTLDEVPESLFWQMVAVRGSEKARVEQAKRGPRLAETVRLLEGQTQAELRAVRDVQAEQAPREAERPLERARPSPEAQGGLPFEKRGERRTQPLRPEPAGEGEKTEPVEPAKAYQRSIQAIDEAFRELVRLEFADIDRPIDDVANSGVMRQLYEADSHLRERFRLARDPFGRQVYRDIAEADASFERIHQAVRQSVEWQTETMLRLADDAGRGQETRDALAAFRLRSLGGEVPRELQARLKGAGMWDESLGSIKLGTEKRLSREFLLDFNRKLAKEPVSGEVALFALPSPLKALNAFGLFSEKISPQEKVWLSEPTLFERMRVDKIHQKVRRRFPRYDKAADVLLAFLKKNLLKPLWADGIGKAGGLPEITPTISRPARERYRTYRRAKADVEGTALDIAVIHEAVAGQMMSEGLSVTEARIVRAAMEAGGLHRIKTPEEFARVFKITDDTRAGALFHFMRRTAGAADQAGLELHRVGGLSTAQLRKFRGRYMARFRPNEGESVVSAALRQQGRLAGAVGREMERISDPTTEYIRDLLDPRYVLPIQGKQEGNRFKILGMLNRLATGWGSISRKQYESLPETQKVDFERLVVLPEHVPEERSPGAYFGSQAHREHFPQETMGEFRRRMRMIRPRQRYIGDFLAEMRDAMDAGKVPETEGKRMLINNLSETYVPSNVAKDMEILITQVDPELHADRLSRWMGGLLQYWRRSHTTRHVPHLVKNFFSSIQTNWQTGKVGPDQFLRMLLTGEGPYAEAALDIPLHENFVLGRGEFKGWAPKDWKRLKDHPAYWQILRFESFQKDAGGSTFAHMFLDEISARDLLGSLVGPARDVPELRDVVDEIGYTYSEVGKRLQPAVTKLDSLILELTGSPNPEKQAQALRLLDGKYLHFEQFFKYAAAIHVAENAPNLTFREATERALEGTADYGARNPGFYAWNALIGARRTPAMERAASSVKAARRGAKIRGPRSVEEARILIDTHTPSAARTLGQFFTAEVFSVYPHVMVPTLFRRVYSSAGGPLRLAASLAAGQMLIRALSTALGGDEQEMLEAMSGPEFPDVQVNAIPSEEAIHQHVERWGGEPPSWFSFFGADASGELMRDWAKRPDFYKKMSLDLLLQSRKLAMARVPSRGAESRFTSFEDYQRPVSTAHRFVRSWKLMSNSTAPWWHANRFFEEHGGFMAGAMTETVRSVMQGAMGRKGRTGWETGYQIGKGLGREFAPMLHPTIAFANPKVTRFVEEALADGQPFENIIAGVENMAVSRQPKSERLMGALVETMLSGRAVQAFSAERFEQGNVAERLIDTYWPEASGDAKTRLERDIDVLSRRTKKQIRDIVVSDYVKFKRDNIDSLDADLVYNLTVGPHKGPGGENGFLEDRPIGKLAEFVREQIGRGFDPDLVDATVTDALEESTFSPARRTMGDLMRRRDIDPAIVGRLWQAMDRAEGSRKEALLRELHRMVIDEKDRTNDAELYWLYSKEFTDYAPQVKSRLRSQMLKNLDEYFDSIHARATFLPLAEHGKKGTPAMMPATKALGPRAFDLAPWLTTEEIRPKAGPTRTRTRRLKALEESIRR